MADSSQHTRPIRNKAMQSFLHTVERSAGLPDIIGAGLRQRVDNLAAPKAFGV